MEHEASEAISLVSNFSFSNVLIKICCAASSCGAMIVADKKALTLAGWEKEEEGRQAGTSRNGQESAPLCDDNLGAVPVEYNWARVQSHRWLELGPAKIIN